MSRIDDPCKIVAHERVGPDIYLLTLRSSMIAKSARPGQFAMVEVKGPTARDPLLRRPFSIAQTDASKETFKILYKVIGRGTSLLAQMGYDSQIRVLGPLGRGFSLGEPVYRIIVGGGLGIAPILFLYTYLKRHNKDFRCILGVRSCHELEGVLSAFNIDPHTLDIVTEDGSLGEKGLVTAPLMRVIKDQKCPYLIQACGPYPMLKAISSLDGLENGKIEVSLESFMACGIGLCLGCAHDTPYGYVHVCKDGPVFKGSEVF